MSQVLPSVVAATVSAVGERRLMLIDCTTCAMREIACGDCVMGVLLLSDPTTAGRPHMLDEVEHDALESLAEVGLVPVLRHRDSA
jgi:hypothetical protein